MDQGGPGKEAREVLLRRAIEIEAAMEAMKMKSLGGEEEMSPAASTTPVDDTYPNKNHPGESRRIQTTHPPWRKNPNAITQ